jgi:hypothetical protein
MKISIESKYNLGDKFYYTNDFPKEIDVLYIVEIKAVYEKSHSPHIRYGARNKDDSAYASFTEKDINKKDVFTTRKAAESYAFGETALKKQIKFYAEQIDNYKYCIKRDKEKLAKMKKR